MVETVIDTPRTRERGLNVGLWGVQVLLGGLFLVAGFGKLSTPLDAMAGNMAWVADVPGWLVRVIGAAEVLGGIGLLLPSLTRILPALTPLAAAGLTLDMVSACVFHIVRGESTQAMVTLILAGLTAFVAWGRFRRVPVSAR